VVPAIRASQLEDLLIGQDVQPANTVPATVDGKTVQQPNPAYAKWVAQDQSVLGYLLSSLTREALLHITTCTTSADVWRTIASLYSTQTRARSVNTHIALTTTRKNQLSISDYFAKVRSYADEMASAGNALTDEELVSYILTGLDEDYNPVFTAIVARIDSVTSSDLYTQLLSFKQHLALQAGGSHGGVGSALAASRGRGGCSSGPGRGPSSGRGRSSGGRGYAGNGGVLQQLVLSVKCVARSGTQPTTVGTNLTRSTCWSHVLRDRLQLPTTPT
jgi:uncharacterized membrane protein YgcG